MMDKAIEWLETEATSNDFDSAGGPMFKLKDDYDVWIRWERGDACRWPDPFPEHNLNYLGYR